MIERDRWQTAEITHPRWLLAGWLSGCALIVLIGLGVLWIAVLVVGAVIGS